MRILALGLLLAAGSAAADTPSSPASPPGVWRETVVGELDNPQSGLRCPFRIGDYYRNATVVFDHYGLDVGCDYRRRGSAITLYLTRRAGTGLDAALATSESEILKFGAERHPKPLGRTRMTVAGLNWTTAAFDEDGGLRSSIWLADLNGWTLEYRSTYAVAEEARVRADLEQMSVRVEASAGARLALCAKAPSPRRSGALITETDVIDSATLSTSLAGGDAMAAVLSGKAKPKPAPVWCADAPAEQGGFHLMVWRAVDATSGADAQADQVTIIDATTRPAPVMQVVPDTLKDVATDANGAVDGRLPRWVATIANADHVMILGYFYGRPSAEAVSKLYRDILSGKAKALGSYSASGKDITIAMPGGS